jgi:hypothetical protein
MPITKFFMGVNASGLFANDDVYGFRKVHPTRIGQQGCEVVPSNVDCLQKGLGSFPHYCGKHRVVTEHVFGTPNDRSCVDVATLPQWGIEGVPR